MTYELIASFVTLTLLEIVLSVDNVIFIALTIEHLPKHKRLIARNIAVALALIIRIFFLFGLKWLVNFNKPLFFINSASISGHSLFLFFGGLFLIYKSTLSIHQMFSKKFKEEYKNLKSGLLSTILQAIFIDLVFSFDSVVTAIGMTTNIKVIVISMVIAMIIMVFFVEIISKFIDKYPSLKMLALAFILMLGALLVSKSFGFMIPHIYIYGTMGFALIGETIRLFIIKHG